LEEQLDARKATLMQVVNDAIMLYRDEGDYLWGLASECGLDYTGTRYSHVMEAIEAARTAFPGLPFMSTGINRATIVKCGIELLEFIYL
jgi:hypothetical protein